MQLICYIKVCKSKGTRLIPMLSGLPENEWFAAAGQELAALKQPGPCFRIKPLILGSIKMEF